jgi:thioredoxin-dependent peroxiredoxin
VVAISTDDRETLARFREELGAPYTFIADPKGEIASRYGARARSGRAERKTFVIGQDGKVAKVQSGLAALEPKGAIEACPLRRPKPDAGG